jgi:DNA-binding transcriptional LysR family regulator
MRLEDMRLFAAVAAARSFTAAARSLGMPKQTVSRRISELEASLGVRLLHRTTPHLHLTSGSVPERATTTVARAAAPPGDQRSLTIAASQGASGAAKQPRTRPEALPRDLRHGRDRCENRRTALPPIRRVRRSPIG